MVKILIDRAVLEQALDMFERGRFANRDVDELEALCDVLHAALEQPQVEQEPVAEVGVIGWKNHLPNSGTVVHWTELMPPLGEKLYTHPQNLTCKSTQHRLATLWGYEKPQPPRQPLTDEIQSLIASMVAELRAHRYCGDCYPENGWPEVNKVLADYAAFKRAQKIGGEA